MHTRFFLLGLRRSGTTPLYETIRSHPNFTAFKEPFRPDLTEDVPIPEENPGPISEPFARRAEEIEDRSSYIPPEEESDRQLGTNRIQYLRWLLDRPGRIWIDSTRLHFRVTTLRDCFPNARIIHLVRDPRAWATSHLKPYLEVYELEDPVTFFEYGGPFQYWSYEQIANQRGYGGTALERLLKIWSAYTGFLERRRPWLTISWERFCRASRSTLARIDTDRPDRFDTGHLHAPNPPAFLQHDRWNELLETCVPAPLHRFTYSFPVLSASRHG